MQWRDRLFWVKRKCQFVVRLKAIEYKEDCFCYLSSYSDLGLQAACLQILSFRPHAFRSFSSGRMPSEFSTKHIRPNLGFVSTIWTLSRTLSSLLTRYQRPAWRQRVNFSLVIASNCNRADPTPGSRTRCIQRVVLSPSAWRFQRPKALCEATDQAGVDL